MNIAFLGPAAVLVAWTMVMMIWVLITRFPAFSRLGLDLSKADPGARYVDVEAHIPARVNWKSHNFSHLMEQPTLFYALTAILSIAGGGESTVVWAWAYVCLRILHSLWQSLVNTVPVRFLLFAASNVCLLVLTYQSLMIALVRT